MKRTHPFGNPLRLVVRGFRVMPHRRPVLSAACAQVLRDALTILLDKRVRHRDDLGGRAVVLKHHDGTRVWKRLVEIEKEAHVSTAPSVDSLVGVAHHEQVFMEASKHAHKLVLQRVDVLELVDHDVFQALLPFQPNVRVLIEDVEHDGNKVVVVEGEALLLLVQISVEDDVAHVGCLLVLFAQGGERHGKQVAVVIGPILELHDLDHVARTTERHIAQREPPLVVDGLKHLIDVGVIEHEKALRVLNGVRILLQHRDAEAVEGVDEARVVVAGERADAVAHLVRGLVGEGDAQDISRHDAEVVYQVCEALRKGARLARSRAGDDADVALRRSNGLKLGRIEGWGRIARKRCPCARSADVVRLRAEARAAAHQFPTKPRGEHICHILVIHADSLADTNICSKYYAVNCTKYGDASP